MRKAALLSCVALGALAAAGFGETRHVPSQYASIQRAIRDCNDGDTVVVAPGIYFETINFSGKNIVVTGTDPYDHRVVAYTVINAEEDGTVVTFENGETRHALLTGFTITGGIGTYVPNFEGNAKAFWGAGIYCVDSSPTITRNIIAGNRAVLKLDNPQDLGIGWGGGIGCLEGSPVISHNVIRQNSAYVGGGILAYISGADISNNLIYGNSGTIGGGVVLLGGTLTNNTIVENDADLFRTGEERAGNLYVAFDPTLGRTAVCNNIICNAPSGGGVVYVAADPRGLVAYNNVWNNFPGNYGIPDLQQFNVVHYGLENDLTGLMGNISEDPLFLDTWNRDYHLTLASPCVNAGDPDYVPSAQETDIDGDSRIQVFRIDIGADEYPGYIKPVAFAGLDQHILEPFQAVTLDGTQSHFNDPCGVTRFQWTQVGGPPVALDDPNAAQPTFTPETDGQYVFELVVADEQYTSELPDQVLVLVAGNRSPVSYAGPDKVWRIPGTVVLDGTGSHDPDPPDRLSYAWTQIDGPAVTLEDAGSATPWFHADAETQYRFELVVSDGFVDSAPSYVNLVTVRVVTEVETLDVSLGEDLYPHYCDVSGTKAVFATGMDTVYTWQIACKDFRTGQLDMFDAGGISTQPKIEGDVIVWSGGPSGQGEVGPECVGVFVRDLSTRHQRVLRSHSDTSSFSHPAVSGHKVVWIQHLEVDRNVPDNWHAMPYDICGADIADFDEPVYFTVATNVGRRDPFPYRDPMSDYDDVVDICGDVVVWEGGGDIYAADVSDLAHIRVFTVCDHPARQYDPAISGRLVVWTDERNDGGDIYGADLSDLESIRQLDIVRTPGVQQQAMADGPLVAYVEGDQAGGRIGLACVTLNHGVLDIEIPGLRLGMLPVLDGATLVWLSGPYGPAQGLSLDVGYSIFDGQVRNARTETRYDYVRHAIVSAETGDEVVVPQGIHAEKIDFAGKAVTVRSTDPTNAEVVAATVLQAFGDVVTFARNEDAGSVLDGLTISGGSRGILCCGVSPTIRRCTVRGNRGCGVKLLNESNLTMVQCTFVANDGPGIEMWTPRVGRTVRHSLATIRNCIVAANRQGGIDGGKPTIINSTIVENLQGGILRAVPTVANSIVFFNDLHGEGLQIGGTYGTAVYSDIQGGWPGDGNIDADPLFVALGHWADPADADVTVDPDTAGAEWVPGDYHLQSQGWRWDDRGRQWVSDAVTSPCIDAGDPDSPLLDEPLTVPQDPGGPQVANPRINMGAYGGTAQASLAPSGD